MDREIVMVGIVTRGVRHHHETHEMLMVVGNMIEVQAQAIHHEIHTTIRHHHRVADMAEIHTAAGVMGKFYFKRSILMCFSAHLVTALHQPVAEVVLAVAPLQLKTCR